jgi:tripartite-type tricarboxylate transporter receptor subunit TctC
MLAKTKRALRVVAAGLLLLPATWVHSCLADEVSDFYAGKTISLLVGYEAGGGYDLYARLVAQFLGRYVPGHPTIIVQNMPGAGGLKAARYLLEAAPKDGTVLGIPAQTIAFDSLLGYSAGVDAGKFQWLGRVATNVEVGAAFAKTGIASVGDLRTREVSIGGTGGTASTSVIPFLLNKLAGTRFKIVNGYRSAVEVILAMQRGEMDMVGGIGLATVEVRFGKEIKDGTLRLIFQSGVGRDPLIPNVPNIAELGRSDEDKQMLALFSSTAAIGRSMVAPPGVPVARVGALRQAIAAMLTDTPMRQYAAGHSVTLEPGSAEEIEGIIGKTLGAPPELAQKTRAVLESMKTQE